MEAIEGSDPRTVDHIDHDPSNNSYLNLRYLNQSEQMKNIRPQFRLKGARAPISLTAVDSQGKEVHFASQSEAERQLGVSQPSISKCLRGQRKGAYSLLDHQRFTFRG
jgi:hypothetical protein